MFLDALHDFIVDSKPLRENHRTYRVYHDCPIVLCGKSMFEDLVELPMHDFDVFLGMD